jgi:steroid 5-alpha reductase family enzyme
MAAKSKQKRERIPACQLIGEQPMNPSFLHHRTFKRGRRDRHNATSSSSSLHTGNQLVYDPDEVYFDYQPLQLTILLFALCHFIQYLICDLRSGRNSCLHFLSEPTSALLGTLLAVAPAILVKARRRVRATAMALLLRAVVHLFCVILYGAKQSETSTTIRMMYGSSKGEESSLSYWLGSFVYKVCCILPHAMGACSSAMGREDCTVLGILLFCIGFLVETLANYQMFFAEKNLLETFSPTGLWAFVKQPNYSGELILYVGILVVHVPALYDRPMTHATLLERLVGGYWRIVVAILGPILVGFYLYGLAVGLLPVSYTQTMAHSQYAYGVDLAYTAYVDSMPVFVPRRTPFNSTPYETMMIQGLAQVEPDILEQYATKGILQAVRNARPSVKGMMPTGNGYGRRRNGKLHKLGKRAQETDPVADITTFSKPKQTVLMARSTQMDRPPSFQETISAHTLDGEIADQGVNDAANDALLEETEQARFETYSEPLVWSESGREANVMVDAEASDLPEILVDDGLQTSELLQKLQNILLQLDDRDDMEQLSGAISSFILKLILFGTQGDDYETEENAGVVALFINRKCDELIERIDRLLDWKGVQPGTFSFAFNLVYRPVRSLRKVSTGTKNLGVVVWQTAGSMLAAAFTPIQRQKRTWHESTSKMNRPRTQRRSKVTLSEQPIRISADMQVFAQSGLTSSQAYIAAKVTGSFRWLKKTLRGVVPCFAHRICRRMVQSLHVTNQIRQHFYDRLFKMLDFLDHCRVGLI